MTDGRHFKRFWLLGGGGQEKLVVSGVDSIRKDRRATGPLGALVCSAPLLLYARQFRCASWVAGWALHGRSCPLLVTDSNPYAAYPLSLRPVCRTLRAGATSTLQVLLLQGGGKGCTYDRLLWPVEAATSTATSAPLCTPPKRPLTTIQHAPSIHLPACLTEEDMGGFAFENGREVMNWVNHALRRPTDGK